MQECSGQQHSLIGQASGQSPGVESGGPWQMIFGAGLSVEQHHCSLVLGVGLLTHSSLLSLLPLDEPVALEQRRFEVLFCRAVGRNGTHCFLSFDRRLTVGCGHFHFFPAESCRFLLAGDPRGDGSLPWLVEHCLCCFIPILTLYSVESQTFPCLSFSRC